jgi:MATE family multidrug resistance protein
MSSPRPDSAPALSSPPGQTGPLGREVRALLTLAAPVIGSQFATNALALLGTAVVGRLGAGQLAAAAYASASYYLGFMVLLGVMLSVAPRVAAAAGAGDPVGIARAFRGGLWLAGLLSAAFLPIAFVAAWGLEQLAPAGLRGDLAGDYLRLYALGMPATLAFAALRGGLEGTGHARTVTLVAVAGVALVAVLSPALAFGWGPLPALQLRGAALGSALTSWVLALTLLPLALRRLPRPALPAGAVRSEVGALARLGWPIGLTLGAEGGLFSVTALLMARFGPDALAAHNVALQVITAVFMLPLGLATATGIRVAQAHGAGQLAAARRSGLVGAGVAIALMAGFSLVYIFAPHLLIGLFVNLRDPANAPLIASASAFLLIATLFQMFDGLQVTANAALRGLQDTRIPLLISLAAYWVVGLGFGSLLAFGLGVGPRGLWFGLTAGLIFAAVALLTRFLHHTRPDKVR